ncbi:MAG: hypothetical protein Q9219_007707, partial [cf. Caloplaca sp. 3 TL-2023]
CDEAKPNCSYCLKKSAPCRMPESQFDVAWRDQNTVASRVVERRVRGYKAVTEAEPGEKSTGRRRKPSSISNHVPRVLPQDFDGYALAFFFNSYLLPSMGSDTYRGYLDCVLPVWNQIDSASPLLPALNAVSKALLEAWSRINPNSPNSRARTHYMQGVVAVGRRLQINGQVTDDMLVATLMLDMYDGITSFCGARPHEGPHMTGRKALVDSRRKLAPGNETSQKIISAVRSQVVGQALGKRQPVSADVAAWTRSITKVPRTPAFDLKDIDLEVANLQASMAELTSLSVNEPSIIDALAQATELDQRLVAWSLSIPPDWISMWIANILNGHCSSRIKVNIAILACLERLGEGVLGRNGINARAVIQDSADTICASVPYHLANRAQVLRIDDRNLEYPTIGPGPSSAEHYDTAAAYGGMFLAKRLGELIQPDLPLRDGQRQWIFGQMQRIGRIYLASSEGIARVR